MASLLPHHGEKVSQQSLHDHSASRIDVTVEAETICLKGFVFNSLLVFWGFIVVCLFCLLGIEKKQRVAGSFVIPWDHPFRAGGEGRAVGWVKCIHG